MLQSKFIIFYFIFTSISYAGSPIPSSAIYCKPQKGESLSLIENTDRNFYAFAPQLGMGFDKEKDANELYDKNFKALQNIMREACKDVNFDSAPEFVSKIHRECSKLCTNSAARNSVKEMCDKKCTHAWSSAASYLEGYANAMANEDNCAKNSAPKGAVKTVR